MKSSPNLSRLYVGSLLLLAGGLSAWSAGRTGPGTEASPMELLLAGKAEESAVTWDLPVTRNERVDDWIGFLQDANANNTRLWLERSGKYGPLIRAELRRRGMPGDLLYLALIESGFSPQATSTAAAVGIWQFIAETGRRYGLQVTNEVDERRDPVKATAAALDYLQELYDRFGSWYLAAAAYNTGENRVERVLKERAGGARGSDSLFWRIAPNLPQETRNYVPLMLAAGHIAKEPEKYGFDGLDYQEPLAYEIAWVPGATDLALIAEAAGVDVETVVDLNPHLIRRRTPSGRGWAVRLPDGTRTAFAQGFPQLYRTAQAKASVAQANATMAQAKATMAQAKASTSRAKASTSRAKAGSSQAAVPARGEVARTHRVAWGETLGGIARRYGVSVAALRGANGNLDPRRLRAGRTLKLPTAGTVRVAKVSAKASPKAVAPKARVHTVRRGENLSVIAARFDVSVKQLQRWNSLSGRSRIYAGQRLRVRV